MKSIIVDKRLPREADRALRALGFSPIYLEACSHLGIAISSHPDTLIFKYKDRLFFDRLYEREHPSVFERIKEASPAIRLVPCEDGLGSVYPSDTRYNALLMGKELFLRKESASRAILSLAKEEGLFITPVKQGYPACTVLAFGKSAITADAGMAKALKKRGIEVTLIRQGHISLPPHEYGFIGGSSFVLESSVYFFGDYRLHPDGNLIEGAVRSAGFTPVALGSFPLIDLGGAVVVEEST